MATPTTLLFAASKPITFALVLKALRRDYSAWLASVSQVQSPPAFAATAAAVSEALQQSTSIDAAWEDQQEQEARGAYMTRIEAALEVAKSCTDYRLVLVSEGVLGDLSILARQPQDSYALVCIHSDRSVTFRGKTDVYPFLAHAREVAASVTETVKSVQVSTSAAAVVSDLKRIAGKQSTELLKALDTYSERLVTAIDRTHDQSEKHLEAIENALYKKSQAKLGRLDDFIQAQKPITAGLEEAKREIEESSEVYKLQKRLDAVNTMLQRCQSDLKALDDMNEFADDGLGKALSLHILEDVIVRGTTVVVKVVNLKPGTFRGVQLQVTDEQGDVRLDVPEVRPGVQTIPLALRCNLGSVQRLRLVFLQGTREISNELVITFADPQPKSPVQRPSSPRPPKLPKDPPAVPSGPPAFFPGPPSFPPGPPLGPQQFMPPPPPPLPFGPPMMQAPQYLDVDDAGELNEREKEILSKLDGVLEVSGDGFRQKFLSVVRGPGGEKMKIDEIADALFRQ